MENRNLNDFTAEEVSRLLKESVDAIIVVDGNADMYKTIVRRGFFEKFLKESGSYHDLILDLWFHFNESNEKVSEDYQVFADNTGVFKAKYSRRLRLALEGEEKPHLVQLTIYPYAEGKYIFLLDEFIDSESLQETLTSKKINTIQNSYLFSMYIDLAQDTTSSINVAEISDDIVNYNLKYSEYLKKNFTPGRTASYDCMMRNLEGNFIWVKLTFSRAQTNNDDDYRFVFLVQDIHENSIETLSALKKYEELAITDPLTGVYNHGEIETQLHNALALRQKYDDPVSVMMLDLDLFKSVNDTYGHSVGDAALKQFAAIMKDVASDDNTSVGRWGGEEFVIVCYDKGAEAVDRCYGTQGRRHLHRRVQQDRQSNVRVKAQRKKSGHDVLKFYDRRV